MSLSCDYIMYYSVWSVSVPRQRHHFVFFAFNGAMESKVVELGVPWAQHFLDDNRYTSFDLVF